MKKNLFNIFKDKKEEGDIFTQKPQPVGKKHHVAICIPNSREFTSTDSMFSIMTLSVPPGLSRALTTKDMEPICHCRNEMVREAIEKQKDLTHVLMLETRMKVNPGLLWEIFTIKADIVSVPTFGANPPYHPNIYKNANEPYMDFDRVGKDDQKIRSVDIYATDPGCVLIDKKIFLDRSVGKFDFGSDYTRSDMFRFSSKARESGYIVKATTKLWGSTIATMEIGYNHFRHERQIMEENKVKDIEVTDI